MSVIYLIFLAFAIFIGVTFSISLITRLRMKKNPSFCPIEAVTTFIMSLSLLAGALFYFEPKGFLLQVGIFFFLAISFVYVRVRFNGWKLFIFSFFICLIGTALLPKEFPLLEVVPAGIAYPILALCWLGISETVMLSDRTSWLSLMTVLGQGFFFLWLTCTGYLQEQLLVLIMITIIIVSASILTVRVWTNKPVLGKYPSLSLGFLLGGIWTTCLAFNMPLVVLNIWCFPLFLLICSIISTYFLTRHFFPIQAPTLFQQALDKDFKQKKLLYFVLFMEIMFAMLAFIQIKLQSVFFEVTAGILLLKMSISMKKWGEPKPGIKGVFRDLKQGVKVLAQEVKCNLPKETESEKIESLVTKKKASNKKRPKASDSSILSKKK